MLFHLPTLPTILIDIAAWFVIHLGVSYCITRVPLVFFDTGSWLYKPARWEYQGKIYERLLKIKRWKNRLPDGAAIFKIGFEKKHLKGVATGYLQDFIRDTCRAEFIHWIILLLSPFFFIWNLWWVGILMIIYALCMNLPCILTQRYNRIRLKRVLFKRKNFSV
jgi:glycosyl-4,4'-diaponeurosporenoate acyltransferase